MSMFGLIIGLIGWLFFSAFFSGVETGFYVFSRIRLAVAVAGNQWGALMVQRLMKRPEWLLVAILVGTNLSNFAASGFGMKLLEYYSPAWSGKVGLALLNTLIMSPIILLFCEMVPKNVFRIRASDYISRTAGVVLVFLYLFLPVVILLDGISRLFGLFFPTGRAPRQEVLSRKAMEAHLFEGHEAGAISREQDRIARNILGLAGRKIGEVMTPLSETAMVPENISENDMKRVISSFRYSRYPVYRERKDNIIGVINALDLLYTDKPFLISAHLRQPLKVEPGEPVDGVLLDMRAARMPFGVVAGPDGSAKGVFTIKDLVEEIVGELREW